MRPAATAAQPDKLGKQLSYVRFLYIAMHRDRFRDEVLSELLPPLEPDGTQPAVGGARQASSPGLTYQEADQLSRTNKEFIQRAVPRRTIYASLLPRAVQKVIGEVGAETRGVREDAARGSASGTSSRIDPFDGGPHFEARAEEVTLVVRKFRTARVAAEDLELDVAEDMLVSVEREAGRNRFRAVRSQVRIDNQVVYLPAQAKELLGVSSGVKVSLIPFESG